MSSNGKKPEKAARSDSSPANPRKSSVKVTSRAREESSDGTSESNLTMSGSNEGGLDGIQIPLQQDTMTFEGRQHIRLQEMEKRLKEELRKKSRDWDKDVEHMRKEFLELYPVDAERVSGDAQDDIETNGGEGNDSLIAKRRGSTDVLDPTNMKTLFLEYPDSGRRCKLRFNSLLSTMTILYQEKNIQFNLADFDPAHIEVATDVERIIVTAKRSETDENGKTYQRIYQRKIEKPKEVDHLKLKSFLTTDGILIVEAPLPPATLNLCRKTSSHSPSRSSSTGKRGSNASIKSKSPPIRSPSVGTVGKTKLRGSKRDGSCGEGAGGSSRSASGDYLSASSSAPQLLTREKYGVPILSEDSGRRKVMLTLDIGQTFSPKEISVQIIKDNRIQVKAKHEERTSDRLFKNKFSKDYELPEKIETYSLRGGVTSDGKLLVGALIKGHATGLNKVSAGEMLTEDLNSRAEIQPCNILDLSTFPPTTPALIMASASWSNPHAQQ